jgi:hypothetical protein
MAASTGNFRSRATIDQFECITATVDLHPNLLNRPLPRRRCSYTGAVAPAAATTPLCRARPPVVPLPQSSTGIESPRDLRAVPRPRPAGHGHRVAGFWPDRRRPAPKDSIASPQIFPGTHPRSKGIPVTL